MTLHFQGRGTEHDWISWCKKLLEKLCISWTDDVPTQLIAFALWVEDFTGNPFHVSESFTLDYSSPTSSYFGQSATAGKRVEIEVRRLPTPNHYDVILDLFEDNNLFGTQEWLDQVITADPSFDSGSLTIGGPPPLTTIACQLLG